MKLKVKALYQCRDTTYQPGSIIDVPEEEAIFLLSDAPGVFEKYHPRKAKRVKRPPRHKMVEEPAESK